MRFIPIDKMSKLREAARNGDEHAKKILFMQMEGKEDFSSLLDDYFKPKTVPNIEIVDNPNDGNSRLETFLKDNNITKDDPEYNDFVEEFYKEFPNEKNPVKSEEDSCCETLKQLHKLKGEEIDAIDSYSKAIIVVMNDPNIDSNKKKKVISRFKEIRGDEEQHDREIDELISLIETKDEEKLEGTVE